MVKQHDKGLLKKKKKKTEPEHQTFTKLLSQWFPFHPPHYSAMFVTEVKRGSQLAGKKLPDCTFPYSRHGPLSYRICTEDVSKLTGHWEARCRKQPHNILNWKPFPPHHVNYTSASCQPQRESACSNRVPEAGEDSIYSEGINCQRSALMQFCWLRAEG